MALSLPCRCPSGKRRRTQQEQGMQSFILSIPSGLQGGQMCPEGRTGAGEGRESRRSRGWWRRWLRGHGRGEHRPGSTSGTVAERGGENKGAGDDLTMVLQSGTEGPVLRAFSRICPEIVTELQDGPSLRRRGGGASIRAPVVESDRVVAVGGWSNPPDQRRSTKSRRR